MAEIKLMAAECSGPGGTSCPARVRVSLTTWELKPGVEVKALKLFIGGDTVEVWPISPRALRVLARDLEDLAEALEKNWRGDDPPSPGDRRAYPCTLVMDDWRLKGKSVYDTEEGLALRQGDFHAGTAFGATITLDDEDAGQLKEAMRKGYRPVFWMADINMGGKGGDGPGPEGE